MHASASALLQTGCTLTICNWNKIRPSSCGAQSVEASIVYSSQAPPLAPLYCTFLIAWCVTRTFFIDSNLSMTSRVLQTVSRCFSVLSQLCRIRRQVATAEFHSLVVAPVLSRLDYCNSLAGLLVKLIQSLKSAQNAAARLIFRIGRYHNITDALTTECPSESSSKLPSWPIHHSMPVHQVTRRCTSPMSLLYLVDCT